MSSGSVPCIRDMTKRCKGCGNYCFPDDINKHGLCPMCARGEVPPKKETNDDNSGWCDW